MEAYSRSIEVDLTGLPPSLVRLVVASSPHHHQCLAITLGALPAGCSYVGLCASAVCISNRGTSAAVFREVGRLAVRTRSLVFDTDTYFAEAPKRLLEDRAAADAAAADPHLMAASIAALGAADGAASVRRLRQNACPRSLDGVTCASARHRLLWRFENVATLVASMSAACIALGIKCAVADKVRSAPFHSIVLFQRA